MDRKDYDEDDYFDEQDIKRKIIKVLIVEQVCMKMMMNILTIKG